MTSLIIIRSFGDKINEFANFYIEIHTCALPSAKCHLTFVVVRAANDSAIGKSLFKIPNGGYTWIVGTHEYITILQ